MAGLFSSVILEKHIQIICRTKLDQWKKAVNIPETVQFIAFINYLKAILIVNFQLTIQICNICAHKIHAELSYSYTFRNLMLRRELTHTQYVYYYIIIVFLNITVMHVNVLYYTANTSNTRVVPIHYCPYCWRLLHMSPSSTLTVAVALTSAQTTCSQDFSYIVAAPSRNNVVFTNHRPQNFFDRLGVHHINKEVILTNINTIVLVFN